MNKALIVTGQLDSPHMLSLDPEEYDYVICADKGYLVAQSLGITPDHLIGDFDSARPPKAPNITLLPAAKDMTDTEAALDKAFHMGYRYLTVLGGLGGRFDHTMGNIAMLKKYLALGADIRLLDGQNHVYMREPGRYQVYPQGYRYLGLMAYDSPCTKLCVTGTKYPLEDYTLTNETSLCVSNEIAGRQAEISFETGTLLVIQSRDGG